MTIHSYGERYSNFQCPNCGAYYVPYAKHINCPKCGKNESRESEFIGLAVTSLRHNMKKWKSYMAKAWFKGCFSDHMLYLVFFVFEAFVQKGEKTEFENFVSEEIASIDFEDQEYLRKHLLEMVLDIRKEMSERKRGWFRWF